MTFGLGGADSLVALEHVSFDRFNGFRVVLGCIGACKAWPCIKVARFDGFDTILHAAFKTRKDKHIIEAYNTIMQQALS